MAPLDGELEEQQRTFYALKGLLQIQLVRDLLMSFALARFKRNVKLHRCSVQ